MSKVENILIGGKWKTGDFIGTFQAVNPSTQTPLEPIYPVSSWKDIEEAIRESRKAAQILVDADADRIGNFLERYADRLESRGRELVALAHEETALAKHPRLESIELPRTTNQLRQAAQAARACSWMLPTIDTRNEIRSRFGPLGGAVVVFGPNNFPFAFNSVAGGDFAAAIVARNPVIAKAHPGHPGTSRLLAEEALMAVQEAGLPAATVQLFYQVSADNGKRLVADPFIGATAYTGSRQSGLALKEAADRAGKLIYLELSSINPLVLLPGALKERGKEIADDFAGSCLMAAGQFCTNPGLILLIAGTDADRFVADVSRKFQTTGSETLLSETVLQNLHRNVEDLVKAGAELIVGGEGSRRGYSFPNTLLSLSGASFLENSSTFQKEAFGNAALVVLANNFSELLAVLDRLDGNLTASIYSHRWGEDDALYDQVAAILRRKVGRLLNDKMPTGVAVSPAMNHGGPYPATAHPGFTSVGIPASVRRFAMLECYDHVRESRLPVELRNQNAERIWRCIDGQWNSDSIAPHADG
jgi:alpha-ketoglutaric semialdehyde dehydrogenase